MDEQLKRSNNPLPKIWREKLLMLHENRAKMEDFIENHFFAAMYRFCSMDIGKWQKKLLEEQFERSQKEINK